ncbi:methyltransferase [Candidatus Saccharibacteria bacterium]|nr:methyltransferase [Candidatus Saccharibacteria bacterium]|tara:strand:+ start:1181 stop:2434 length:1254 start_codon:yes stop_codon:yes gene_type:complete
MTPDSLPPRYEKINECRIGGGNDLVSVLNLGHQALTGVFPKDANQSITSGPLELVWSPKSGLLQLGHSYSATEMYGENYGYRSGLNQSMVDHLTRKARMLEQLAPVSPGDTVLDIGSNDGTLLKAYSTSSLNRIGIDPTGIKFKSFYPPDIQLVPDFFSKKAFYLASSRSATLITSIAMFYDLEDPIGFAREIEACLTPEGIWHFEQSYMPSMLRLCSYDTICHEHIEFYSLSVVKKILECADLKIIDVQMNAVNGGSFAVTAAKKNSSKPANDAVVNWLLENEHRMGLNTPRPYRDFEERVYRHREDLRRLLQSLVADGKKIIGYGASTKGNVVLQFCNITNKELSAIAEVNPDKFGCYTPGTSIPIVSESEARSMRPDYLLILPWHFKDGIVRREQAFLDAGGKLIIPFPEIEII